MGQGRLAVPSGQIDLVLVKPQTFMNRSGRSIQYLLQVFGLSPSEMIVVYDDLDLPCGRIRVRTKGSAGAIAGWRRSSMQLEPMNLFVSAWESVATCQDPADYVLTPFDRKN